MAPVAVETSLRNAVERYLSLGARFCGLFATAQEHDTQLTAVLAGNGVLFTENAVIPSGSTYASLTSIVASAEWYEREIHDLFGLRSEGARRLDSLVLPLHEGAARPRPGSGERVGRVEVDTTPLLAHVAGEGVFTIPYGPVRSGVFEAIEYLVETPGEDIPHLRTRVFYKHRGTETRFEGCVPQDGVLVAERCEGVASVAHAMAFCTAIESLAGVDVPRLAQLVRVLHAELERIANHLDSTIRHTEAAGQAVAFARFTTHKERVQRLRAALCGSRFGRSVVVPGGVASGMGMTPDDVLRRLDELEGAIHSDFQLLMNTPSFLDRLRGTGVLTFETLDRLGALGPLARGSGVFNDARFARPYAAYGHLGHAPLNVTPDGDALARQWVRIHEISGAFHLSRQVIDELTEQLPGGTEPEWAAPVPSVTGDTVGWSEAPQGELLYLISVRDGVLTRVKSRSASFHNLAIFSLAFPNDILTDFAFIEASFGLSTAGAAS